MAALSSRALPEGRAGQALALGVTVVAAGLVWLLAVQPLMDAYQAESETLRQSAALAGRMRDLVSTLPALRREAAAVAKAGPPKHATLSGSTDAVATAALQGMLESMVTTAGAHLTSAEALPGDQQGQYRRVALRLAVDATWPTLVMLLQAIERATPHMFVDDLQVHAQPTSERQRELPLDISFTVLAFRAPAPGESGRSKQAAAGGAAGSSDQGEADQPPPDSPPQDSDQQ